MPEVKRPEWIEKYSGPFPQHLSNVSLAKLHEACAYALSLERKIEALPTPERLREMAGHLCFAAEVGSERNTKLRVAMAVELRTLADALEGKSATEP